MKYSRSALEHWSDALMAAVSWRSKVVRLESSIFNTFRKLSQVLTTLFDTLKFQS